MIGIASDPLHPCCRTRVCDQIIAANTSSADLIAALVQLGPTLGERAVLVPCTDLSVLLLSRHRDEISPWYQLSLPAAEVVELLVDKERFYRYAQREELPIPLTFFLRSRADAERAADALRFPCIVKPTLKTPMWRERSGEKAYSVANREALLALYDRVSGWVEVLVAQDLIVGGDGNHFTCNCYFGRDSEPLVTFTSRKLRQWPPTGGEGCLSEEARNDAVEEQAVRLFRAAGLAGLGYLEVKRDERTGEHLIIEPNIGRPTGRSACAEGAGVALLYTMYCDVLGLPLPANRRQSYRGVKWIHFRRDFQAALYHWRRGDLSLRQWLDSWRGPKVDALFSWNDPVPFFADAARVGRELVARHTGRYGDLPVSGEVST